jgi:hypothetical protein
MWIVHFGSDAGDPIMPEIFVPLNRVWHMILAQGSRRGRQTSKTQSAVSEA